MHKEEGLSFANVVTFNLDEYYPMDKSNIQSYFYFMHEHLFNHVDISSRKY
jgi:glucosamine-6-phosphate deaminase